MSSGIHPLSSRGHSSFWATRLTITILSWTLGVVSSSAVGQRAVEKASFATPAHPEKYVPDRLLVRFRSGQPAAAKAQAHIAVGAKVLSSFHQVRNLELVALPSGQDVLQAAQLYRQNPDVLYAEPDYRVFPSVTPNDPLFPLSWGMLNNGDPQRD